MNNIFWMKRAILIAKKALKHKNIPIGCVLVNKNFEIGIGFNHPKLESYPFLHAEIITIKQGFYYCSKKYLNNSILYITLEPCLLCLLVIFKSNIKHIIFSTYYKDKMKSIIKINHFSKMKIESGILEKKSNKLLNKFFNNINNKHFP